MFPFQVVYRDETQAARALYDERLLALIRFRESAAPLIDPRSGVIPLPELNTLRILGLPEEAKAALRNGVISEGHAKALLGAKEAKLINELLEEVISNGYSVRETERRVKERNAGAMAKKPEIKKYVESGLDEFLERKVKQVLNLEDIKIEKKRSFIRLSFDFSSEDEINQWLKKLRK